jgi:hypothetical protein
MGDWVFGAVPGGIGFIEALVFTGAVSLSDFLEVKFDNITNLSSSPT